MSQQRATQRCDCGGVIDVTPTSSAWEFDWQCRDCTRCGNISWFHGVEPPTYLGEQLRLFGEQVRQGMARQGKAVPGVSTRRRDFLGARERAADL